MYKYHYWLLSILLLGGIGGCATPTTPTGGPPDEQGPKIIRTEPVTGTTNFEGRTIVLHFSEFVERSSLQQAITVEPDIGISYEIDWGRKSAAIEFKQAIPDSTTLILSIGTDLKDTQNNEMSSPQKVAVSTGDEIDEGEIIGNILDAATGEGTQEGRVLLYREPYDLSKKADYTATMDTSGTFRFSYLPADKFKLFWVDDRNRNKIWEPEQERAQPFKEEFVALEKAQKDTVGTLYATSVDTTNPVLQGVGLFSSNRMRMRFSENISLSDSLNISITDTLGNSYSDAFPLYIQPGEPYILFAQSVEPLAPESSYQIKTSGIFDRSDNGVEEYGDSFTGSAQEDTTRQRIVKRNTTSGYYPGESFEITYAKTIDEDAIVDSLKVIEGDTLIDDWEEVSVARNVLRINPPGEWKDGVTYEIRVWDPLIEDYRKFDPQIWHQSKMGALNIVMKDSSRQDIRLTLENGEAGFIEDTLFSKQVEIDNLPPLKYKLTVYHDKNGNNRWDYGQVAPYKAPEPFYIRKQLSVEKELTGDLTLEFPK